MRVEIVRLYVSDGKQTDGILYVIDDNKVIYECYTLELPWLDNQNNISCIPAGKYTVVKRKTKDSNFKYEHFHIKDVEGREWILIHKGNYYTQIRGCVLVGEGLSDINSDGILDVTSSGVALGKLLDILPDEFELDIRWRE